MSKQLLNGIESDSTSIKHNLAHFTDRNNELWSARWQELQDEIALRETDLEDMTRTMPNDGPGLAHLQAYIVSLKQTRSELMRELSPRKMSGTHSGIHILPRQ